MSVDFGSREHSVVAADLNVEIDDEPSIREKLDYLYEVLANYHLIGCTFEQC